MALTVFCLLQACQPSAEMPAVPPEKYAHHLQSFLLQRFCQASGLSREQAMHPEASQQGIASLVSALGCNANKSSAAAGCKATDKQHASSGAARRPAAGSETFQHVSAPSILYPSRSKQRLYKSAPPVACEERTLSDSLFCSSDPAGLQEERGVSQGMRASAYPWRQQGKDQSASMGVQGVSLRFPEDDFEAELPDLAASDLGPRDCLDSWMDSIHSPEPSLDRVPHKDDRYSMHSMPSASPDLLLTEHADVAGMSPDAHTLGGLPSSPQLADVLDQYAADSLQEKLLKADDYSDAEVEQACANDMGAAAAGDSFLHMLSKGAEAELETTGLPDLQQLRWHREPHKDAHGLGGSDKAWPHDPADLQNNACELFSDLDALYSRARSGKQHVWLEADPDPVAAFSGFCESLAM